MTKKTRTRHTATFKAKVALAAIREEESIAQLAKRYGVNATLVHKWKKQFVEKAAVVFEQESHSESSTEREDELLRKIGELTVERDFLALGLERRR